MGLYLITTITWVVFDAVAFYSQYSGGCCDGDVSWYCWWFLVMLLVVAVVGKMTMMIIIIAIHHHSHVDNTSWYVHQWRLHFIQQDVIQKCLPYKQAPHLLTYILWSKSSLRTRCLAIEIPSQAGRSRSTSVFKLTLKSSLTGTGKYTIFRPWFYEADNVNVRPFSMIF